MKHTVLLIVVSMIAIAGIAQGAKAKKQTSAEVIETIESLPLNDEEIVTKLKVARKMAIEAHDKVIAMQEQGSDTVDAVAQFTVVRNAYAQLARALRELQSCRAQLQTVQR